LVDRYGCLGGSISQVRVETIAWYRHEGTIDIEGIGIEFEQHAKAMGGTQKESQSLSEALDTRIKNLLFAGRARSVDAKAAFRRHPEHVHTA